MRHNAWLFIAGWVIVLIGVLLAAFVQTSGGVTIKDVRFTGTGGQQLSALLYIPAGVTPEAKAPGVLAVHGYINSRETQSGFAIEYARRGYVVLALDQTGHGYSDPPAFSNGFGGPAALAYLRSLDIVDLDNIGLKGHSMGGWTILAAASAMPDAYRSMVLEGSSTGAPFAAEGTTSWPRNLAVVFSKFDEFSQLMWAVPRAQDVAASPKLKAVFGSDADLVVGQLYGDIAAGTARVLHQPAVTHPGDHISTEAIGDSIGWFQQTLTGGTPLPATDQIWPAKELGTTIALFGFVVLLAGAFNWLLAAPYFRQLAATPSSFAFQQRTPIWWLLLAISAAVPVLTYFLFFGWATPILPASQWLPQTITSQIAFWAVLNGIIAVIVGFVLKGGGRVAFTGRIVPSILIALATVGIGYLAILVADYFFKVDFRFWVVALKAMSRAQFLIALLYLLPFTLYFLLATRALHAGLSVAGTGRWSTYLGNILAMAGGFLVFLAVQYGTLFATGKLLSDTQPLEVIVAMQFLPLMAIIAFISTYTYRRTASYLPGAFINALFVTWYIVAGQATQFPF